MRARALIFLFSGIVAVVALAGPVMSVESRQASEKRVGDTAVGASISIPEGWILEREEVTFDGTRGFTVWRPDVDTGEHDHGGTPAARVALAYELRPGGIESRVRERLSEYRDVSAKREEIKVGESKAVAVGPIPGGTPSTEVYVPVDGRVYQINVYSDGVGEEGLDADDEELLSTIRFSSPSRTARSADSLPDGGDPATYYEELSEEDKRERAAREDPARSATVDRSAAALPDYGERRISEGCWLAASRYYFQTQHGWHANRFANDPGTNAPTGFTKVGQPNYWGQYTHGNLGYGRCDRAGYTNDKFAVDYPYNKGDAIFSPFKSGTVVFAGRNYSHRHYGIFVVIKGKGGKYVSMSAHLSSLARGIKRGVRVNDATIIGFAGNTGDPSIPVGEVHLHQAFYRYPRYSADGSPYGGASLKVVYHRYLGKPGVRPGGVYEFVNRGAKQTSSRQKTEGEFISN